ncbi:hypothetical protein DSUL_250001 [Desulfovibrionales bacterium]
MLITLDALAPVVFSPLDKTDLHSRYQNFIERTRYLRRSDYLLSNLPLIPVSFEELGASQYLHIRMITSFIRHESVVLNPLVGILQDGKLCNVNQVQGIFAENLRNATRITVGRLVEMRHKSQQRLYNPVGYVLKYQRDVYKKTIQRRMNALQQRQKWINNERQRRIIPFNLDCV